MLGAILVHNDAFNLAAQVIDSRRLLPRRAPPHLRQDGRAQRAQPGDRLRHAERGAVARRRARRRRRAGLRRVAGRRRAARDQRRVLRAHRQREVDAAEPDLRGQQDPHQRLRGRSGIGPDPRRGRERHLRGRRRPAEGRLRPDARPGQGELPEDRAAVRAEAADHRRADRLRRSRRDDARPAGRRPDHRRGAAVDGEDQPGAEHRAVRGHAAGSHGRLLQPGNVEGVAVPAPADVGGADRQPSADERRHRAEGLRPHLARARDAERDAAVHRRHGEHRRARDARQGAAAASPSTASACWSSTTSS